MRWKWSLLLAGVAVLLILMGIGKGIQRQENVSHIGHDQTHEIQMEDHENPEEQEEGTVQNREEETPIPEFNGRIRVLMKTNDYAGMYHEEVNIQTEEEEWIFEWEEGSCSLNGERIGETEFPVCFPEREGKRYTIVSLNRAYGTPKVEGDIEIYIDSNGLVVINDIEVEDYLKYVVPSEMPASYELEALKAQAICARTYAYSQMKNYSYPEYSAHVDDSSSFQVYQNLDAAERTTQAVKETAGQILCYEGQPITAYYFSTSWGHTGNENIWWKGDASKTPYLKGKSVNETGETLDLTTEDAFLSFLRSTDPNCYDSSVSWYRWSTYIDRKTLSDHLNANLLERYQANPEVILTRKGDAFVSMPVKTIGNIKSIAVLERGEGGVLQKIQVTGTRRTIQILTEYNIRALLNVQGETITRQDGSKVKGSKLLPSGYFAIFPEYEDRVLIGFSIEGGGFGHGVGLSQNGANQMAAEGKGVQEILQFFYTGVELSDGRKVQNTIE